LLQTEDYGNLMQTMTRDSWTDERLDDLNDRACTIDDRVGDGFHRMDEEFTAVRREISTQGKELREEMAAQTKELREEMAAQTKELRGEMAAQGKELREEMAALTKELRGEIAAQGKELREEMSTQTKELRGEMKDMAAGLHLRLDRLDQRLDSLNHSMLYGFVAMFGIVVTALIGMAAFAG